MPYSTIQNPEKLEKLCDLLAEAADFINETPQEVLSTRQKDWLLVLNSRCQGIVDAYKKSI